MNYIDDEVFLSAPYNVQEALLNWYTFNDYDRIYDKKNEVYSVITSSTDSEIYAFAGFPFDKKYKIEKEDIVPLFTQEQLIEFIEKKVYGLIQIETRMKICGDREYTIRVKAAGEIYYATDDVVCSNILEGLWQVACNAIEQYNL